MTPLMTYRHIYYLLDSLVGQKSYVFVMVLNEKVTQRKNIVFSLCLFLVLIKHRCFLNAELHNAHVL